LTTTFFLVRHAAHPLLDRVLVGRMPHVALGRNGRAQARQLARRLAREPIALVHSSPRKRARETAQPIAEEIGVSVRVAAAIDEVDVGEWTGTSFAELKSDPRWQRWNRARVSARSPGGESMRDVQERVVFHIDQLRSAHPQAHILFVSHGDVIRAALLFYLRLPLWALDRIEIAPASLSAVAVGDWGAKIVTLNEVMA
jgi:broad specificity phosphatase PhoE